MKVSVILVTYDHERYIAQALESILAQRADFDYEIIVSEDCSRDATRSVLADYSARFPGRIRLCLSERNLNSNVVTSRAIEIARGEYLAFLDGDDYAMSTRKLQLQADFLDANPDFAMCYHNALIINEHGEPTGARHVRPTSPKLDGLGSILAANPVPGPSPMIRRSAVKDLPDWFEDAPFGDWPLYILAALSGRIGYIDATLSAYRVHPGGFWAGTSRSRQYHALIAWYDYLLEHMPAEYAHQVKHWRQNWQTSNWYVAKAGPEFLALHDRGRRWPDGYATRELRLELTPQTDLAGLRLRVANPDTDPRFAGNRIVVEVGSDSRTLADLVPGQSAELRFPGPHPEGEPVWLRAESTVEVDAPPWKAGQPRRRIGFRLEEIAALEETSNPT